MPDYQGDARRPLDVIGLVLFGCGIALLSWLLEVFGEHRLDATSAGVLLAVAFALLFAYGWHSRFVEHPLLKLALFRIRTFRVAVVGGFVTRLGIGGLPFLLPLLYQLGLGLPAWTSGLLMMPAALAAMGMKVVSAPILRRLGFRRVLVINTVMIGIVISCFATIDAGTPIVLIVLNGLAMGFFNSLQFSSMNSLAYADVDQKDASMASTMASSLQQLSMSFGLAFGSLTAAWFLGELPQSDHAAVASALHHAFIALGLITAVSSLSFWTLKARDGENVSKGESEPRAYGPTPEGLRPRTGQPGSGVGR
jgi:MFS family permease